MKHVNKITLLLPLYCLIINAVVFSCSQKQKSDPPPKQSSQKAGVSSHFFNADMYIAGPLLDSMENEARQIEQRFSVDSDRIQLALQDTANDLKTLFTQRQDLVDTFKILQAKSEILYKHINPLREAIEDAGSELSHRLRQFDRLMHRLRRDYEILAVIKTSQIAANIVRSARGAMCKHGVMPTDSFYTYLQMDFEKCKELFKEINELQMGSYGDHLLDSLVLLKNSRS